MNMRLKYVTTNSNDEFVTKSSTVPDCLQKLSKIMTGKNEICHWHFKCRDSDHSLTMKKL